MSVLKTDRHLETAVAALMQKNRREVAGHHYTIPSPQLYPFQWLWDSCFHAIILLRCNEVEKAKQEIYSALARPLPNGLIPHINYWEQPPKGSSWGREHRGDVITQAWAVDGSSSITQPPIIATVVRRIYEHSPNQEFLEAVYPELKAFYEYLWNDRRFNGDPLVYIVNPDESGEDNSPRFDYALGLPPHHTADDHLDKRIELMRYNASCNFHAQVCMSKHFGFADTSFNIIYMEGLRSLSFLAQVIGDLNNARIWQEQADKVETTMKSFLRQEGMYASYDHVNQRYSKVKTWAMFMPLYGGLLDDKEASTLVDHFLLSPDFFYTPYLIPSTAKDEPSYDPDDGFWRGPVWFAPNWFIYHGLKRYGFVDVADELKTKSSLLLEQSGFREHYHPVSGAGIGATDFTWGGLILDMD